MTDSPGKSHTLPRTVNLSESPGPTQTSLVSMDTTAWCVAYIVVAIVTIIGNSIVVAALTHAKFAHKARRLFLISLSAADMLVGAVALPMFVFLIYPSGNALASVSDQRLFSTCYRALDIFTGFASMFTLATISLEHVHAVIWPLEHRALRKRFYFLLVTTSWSLACVLACVFLLTYVGGLLREDIFVYSQTVLSFLSVVIICVSYTAVWIKMKCWVRKASQRLVGGQVHERNLSMALAIVTLVFVVTWLPSQCGYTVPFKTQPAHFEY